MPAAFLVLLFTASVQTPVARWTPEQAFSVKRVGSVAISPDGRYLAVIQTLDGRGLVIVDDRNQRPLQHHGPPDALVQERD